MLISPPKTYEGPESLTVEQCLAELREMNLAGRITMSVETLRSPEWMITVNGYFGHFQGSTLEECMAQVRAWDKRKG